MRKILGTFGATVLAGITAAAIATPASAAACVPVEAVPATEAVYETVEVTPAQPAVPAVEEVSHVESTGWTTDVPAGEEWVEVDRREVVDVEAVPAWTEVITNDDEIPAGYEQTDWVLEAPADGRTWVQIAEQKVIDVHAQPAQGEPTIVVDNPDYVPATTIDHPAVGEPTISVIDFPGQEYIAPTYETEYEFVHKFDVFHLNPKWKTDPNWNAEGNPHSKGWIATGNTRQGDMIDAGQPELPATYKDVPNPDYVPAWTEQVPAQGEPTITIDNPDYVPAVEQVSHVEYKFAWHQAYVPPTTTIVEHPAIEKVSHLEFVFERTVIDVAAVPAVPAVPAVTEQVLVSEAVPAVEAVVCQDQSMRELLLTPRDDMPQADDDGIVTPDVPVLAETGADGIGAAAALGLLLLGVGCVVVARRRQTEV